MSIFKDKTLKSVAEAAAKIMAETSHGTHPKSEKEKSLAALAHPKDKITHKDVLVGRGVLKKEEVELDEANKETKKDFKARQERLVAASAQTAKDPARLARLSKIPGYTAAMDLAKKTTQKEEVELDEEGSHEGRYSKGDKVIAHSSLTGPREGVVTQVTHDGQRVKVKHGTGAKSISFSYPPHKLKKQTNEELEQIDELTAWQKVQRKKEEMEDKRRERMEREDMPEPEKKKPTTQKVAGHRYGGSKQKDETNEETLPFTQMLESYTERGLKALSGIIREEPDNEQWTKELKDQEATAAGKKKPASVAAPSTMGVKAMKEEDELTLDDFTPEEIEEFMQSEEYEQLDELSKSTLGSYIRKATHKIGQHAYDAGGHAERGNLARSDYHQKKEFKRTAGVFRAADKLAKEDVEVIDFTDVYNVQKYTIKDEDIQQERALTEPEMEKKEKIVKGMKKGLEGFKQRYGERAKEVMYATATARAKED